MSAPDRLALIGGPYGVPPWKVGDIVPCLYRDCDVIITGGTGAAISWPIGRRHPWIKGCRYCVVVNGDLVRAVQTEAVIAVAHWWGVSEAVVRNWRRSLGVGMMTPGTTRAFSSAATERLPIVLPALQAEDSRRRAAKTVSAQMRGHAPSHEVPWTPEEDAVLIARGAAESSNILGRSRNACNVRAFRLRNPGYDRRRRKYVNEDE